MKHMCDFKTRLPKLIMQSTLKFSSPASGLMLNYILHNPITIMRKRKAFKTDRCNCDINWQLDCSRTIVYLRVKQNHVTKK
jgi:hypothetical protein